MDAKGGGARGGTFYSYYSYHNAIYLPPPHAHSKENHGRERRGGNFPPPHTHGKENHGRELPKSPKLFQN